MQIGSRVAMITLIMITSIYFVVDHEFSKSRVFQNFAGTNGSIIVIVVSVNVTGKSKKGINILDQLVLFLAFFHRMLLTMYGLLIHVL